MLNQNVQSIGNCIEKLTNVLKENNCKVLTVTEHWKSVEQLSAYKLQGYKLVTSFCRGQGHHGGVAIYCVEKLYVKTRTDINELSECYNFECAGAEVHCENNKFTIVVIYRTPDSEVDSFLRKMYELLERLLEKHECFFIAGDFNIDLKNLDNKNSQNFKSLLDSYSTKVTINDYTRVNSRSQSCIDNILTNVTNNEYTGEVLNSFISDHLMQKLTVKIQSQQENQFKYIRCYNQTNTDLF